MSLTLASYRSAVQIKLEEVSPNTHFSTATLDAQINEAAKQIARKSKCLLKRKDYTTTINVREYDLPADFLIHKYAVISDTNKPLLYQDVDLLDWDLTADVGEPEFFYIMTTSVTVGEVTTESIKIGFSPTPTVAYTIYLFYYAIPTDMTGAADVCSIPDKYADVVVQEAVVKLLKIDKRYTEAGSLEQRTPQLLSDMEFDSKVLGQKQIVNTQWDSQD